MVRVIAPNPGMMTGPGTNTYLLGSGRLALVDPGLVDEQHRDRLLEEASGRLCWILVTHTHIDHSPLSAALKDATGAEIVAFGPAPGPHPHTRTTVTMVPLINPACMRSCMVLDRKSPANSDARHSVTVQINNIVNAIAWRRALIYERRSAIL